MSKKRSKPTTSLLPATLEEAQALMFARDWLAAIRAADFLQLGDPFTDDALHALVRRTFKNLAEWHPRNAARVLRLALHGAEDAHAALADLIAERTERDEPLGPTLATYANILANDGRPKPRRPEGRQRGNFLANFVIVVLLIDMKRRLGLPLRTMSLRRPSLCSIVAQVLAELGLSRGGEEAIWKIWAAYGPPVIPGYGFKKMPDEELFPLTSAPA
jgi:hypothetical protein